MSRERASRACRGERASPGDPSACWFGGVSSRGAMAALASSLIRQKREVREPGGSRPVSAQRRVCPRGTKSLCQKQLLVLLSKVRLCGGRPARLDRGPGEWRGRGVCRAGGSLCPGGRDEGRARTEPDRGRLPGSGKG